MQLYQQVQALTNMVHQEDLVVAVVTMEVQDQEDQELQDKEIMAETVPKAGAVEAEAVKAALEITQEDLVL